MVLRMFLGFVRLPQGLGVGLTGLKVLRLCSPGARRGMYTRFKGRTSTKACTELRV